MWPFTNNTKTRLHRIEQVLLTVLETLDEIIIQGDDLMDDFAELNASVEKFITDVEVYKLSVAEAVAEAVAADDAAESVDIKALKAKVDEAAAKLVPPVFESSNL